MGVEFCPVLFLHLLRLSYNFYPLFCECGISHWLTCGCWIPGIILTWSWYMILLMYFWIHFAGILLGMFFPFSHHKYLQIFFSVSHFSHVSPLFPHVLMSIYAFLKLLRLKQSVQTQFWCGWPALNFARKLTVVMKMGGQSQGIRCLALEVFQSFIINKVHYFILSFLKVWCMIWRKENGIIS